MRVVHKEGVEKKAVHKRVLEIKEEEEDRCYNLKRRKIVEKEEIVAVEKSEIGVKDIKRENFMRLIKDDEDKKKDEVDEEDTIRYYYINGMIKEGDKVTFDEESYLHLLFFDSYQFWVNKIKGNKMEIEDVEGGYYTDEVFIYFY